MPTDAIDIAIEPWQEEVLRRLVPIRRVAAGPLSCRELGIAVGRSETWVRAALRLLDLPTARMRAYRRGSP